MQQLSLLRAVCQKINPTKNLCESLRAATQSIQKDQFQDYELDVGAFVQMLRRR